MRKKDSVDKCSSPGGPGLAGSPHSWVVGFPSFSLSTVSKLTASCTQEKVQGQSSSVWKALHFLSPSMCLLLHISVQTPPGVGWGGGSEEPSLTHP